jgi:hypothetical protein
MEIGLLFMLPTEKHKKKVQLKIQPHPVWYKSERKKLFTIKVGEKIIEFELTIKEWKDIVELMEKAYGW